MPNNDWCRILAIETPSLEAARDHREANTYALFLVALLERGEPMTLLEVAKRFAAAGITSEERALQALKRCKPGRPPAYREGDLYHLDPHDDELDLWAFRLGLRPPKVPRLAVVRPDPSPLPGSDVPLTAQDLDEAWTGAGLYSWSAQRLVLAVLDASGRPMRPEEVVAAVGARTRWHLLTEDSAKFKRHGSAISVLGDGRWATAHEVGDALLSTRKAVRERVALSRRHAAMSPDPSVIEANIRASERRSAAHAAKLARLTRALLVAFPCARPQAAALLDVGAHEITTFVGDEIDGLPGRLAAFDIIGAVDVRALLRAVGFDPGERRLAELGPPQKTKKLNQRGRSLRITTELLVEGSCGISKPFGDDKKLAAYLAAGQHTKVRRRLEADVKSLHALYEYGRLHGAVRLRWGFLDERIPVPWVHHDEPRLGHLKKSALDMRVPLEVVVGHAPGWEDPWSRRQLVHVEEDGSGWRSWLVDDSGCVVDDDDVQLARIGTTVH